MCMCICVRVCVCVHVCVRVYELPPNMSRLVPILPHTARPCWHPCSLYVCIYVYTYGCSCVCAWVCTCVRACVCVCAYMSCLKI